MTGWRDRIGDPGAASHAPSEPRRPCVVAVAGLPGAGKSTLAAALAAALGGAPILHYDDYEEVPPDPGESMEAWIARGAPVDDIEVPGLAEDLGALVRGEAATGSPGRPLRVGPVPARAPYLVFETLLGRAHPKTGQFIDLLFWIELPLDVALARKLGAQLAAFRAEAASTDALALADHLGRYLRDYPTRIRPPYLVQQGRIAAGADHVLDGMRPVADLVREAAARVLGRAATGPD
ncbi:zeta toxin family protein [Methylobacterium segetis]|uniref:zeta toxin family protein n=1 Tax=Methylobacterium segetis TaxID=2488750 RepID=UPI0024785744|nr:zeta toxin family protein [Methylobacterium segetis]